MEIDAETKLLLHADNNSTDSSSSPLTAIDSSTTYSTTHKFGTHSVRAGWYYQQSGGSGDVSKLTFSNDNFVIDFWIYPTNLAGRTYLFNIYNAFCNK